MQYETIGKNNVAVPTHMFKVVLAEKDNSEGNDDITEPKRVMGAFIMQNEPIRELVPLTEYQVCIYSITHCTTSLTRLGLWYTPQ